MANRRQLSPDLERWAEALAIDRQFGDEAAEFISERVTVLAQAGDAKGVIRWLEMAMLCDRLRSGTLQ